MCVCFPQSQVLYQVLRVLLSISSDVVPGICWNHSPCLGVTAPSAKGTTLDLHLHLLHLLQLFFQPLVLLDLLVILLSDVPVGWDPYHYCPLLLVNYHSVCLVSQQLFVSLELEVPQDLTSVVVNHFCGVSHWVLGTSYFVQMSTFYPLPGCPLSQPLGYASQSTLPQLASYSLLLHAGLSQVHFRC